MYADYAFYKDIYLGSSITEADFNRLISRASFYLQQITGNKVNKHAETLAVKMAACAVAEAWQEKEQGGSVLSESVGKWSKTYAEEGKSADKKLYEAAAMYLMNVDLLSRWC